ncbi:unnamed protein product [Blepharisma stoltei]|uniref:PX domain-containing protein n=1 Tax=Blepharisma stoltei TaxID=1481888 RepID=A0AAU9IXC8_9CILI|nr:unnamed protein product [Blepharisma stoltei]
MPYSISIPEFDKQSDYVDYIFLVVDPQTGESWNFKRRYSVLRKISESLKKFSKDAQFPGKKVFGNKNSNFLEQRRNDLQRYFQELVKNPSIYSSPIFQEFMKPSDRKVLNDSKNSQSQRNKPKKSAQEIEQQIGLLCSKIAEETSNKFLDLGAQPNPVEDEDAEKRVSEYFKSANNFRFSYTLEMPEGQNINQTQIARPVGDFRQMIDRLFVEIIQVAEEKQQLESLVLRLDR